MVIKKIIQKINYYMANRSNSAKKEYLKKLGCMIGDGTQIIGSTSGFGSEPYLISIGENCLIAAGVRFFTHDGGVSVLNNLKCFGDIPHDKMGRIDIGNNVYIGTNALICPGVVIGNNCVIGASAVVTKNVPSNSVCVGVPAKVISTIDEYYERAKDKVYKTGDLSPRDKKSFCMKYVKENKMNRKDVK